MLPTFTERPSFKPRQHPAGPTTKATPHTAQAKAAQARSRVPDDEPHAPRTYRRQGVPDDESHAPRTHPKPRASSGALQAGLTGLSPTRPHTHTLPYASQASPLGIQDGRSSVPASHPSGGAPSGPAATMPPTIAHVVSTSPPARAVVQNACS